MTIHIAQTILGLYSDYISIELDADMGKVWRLIALKRQRGCLLVLQSAYQPLENEEKGMNWKLVYLSKYTSLKIMAVIKMSTK